MRLQPPVGADRWLVGTSVQSRNRGCHYRQRNEPAAADLELPHIITNVETTPASTPDDNTVAVVHQSLEQCALLPSEHLVDKGYTDSRVLADSKKQHGVTIVGPVSDDPSWQPCSDDGLTKSQFLVDSDRQVVTCPAGKQSISWLPRSWPENGMQFEARVARKDCTPCSLRSRCTRAKNEPRIIGLRAREHYEALQSARQHQTTEEFQQRYAAGCDVADISDWRRRTCSMYNRSRRQLGQDRRLVRRGSCGSDATLTPRCPADGRPIAAWNSPPVSTLGLGQLP